MIIFANRLPQAVGASAFKVKPARTKVEVLARCHFRGRTFQASFQPLLYTPVGPVTKVRLSPLTGRRHQLRVHMRHAGHPLVGDATYDSSPLAEAPRMCLHARMLSVTLPDGRVLALISLFFRE